MNTYNINDKEFLKSETYQKFKEENPAYGNLKIRVSAANGAVPIKGAKAIVSKEIENNNVIFFEGYTDKSGVIEKISLPTPELDMNDMDVPEKATYKLVIKYLPENVDQTYDVNMYDNICVVQNINIVPNLNLKGED